MPDPKLNRPKGNKAQDNRKINTAKVEVVKGAQRLVKP
jgi:hypothetical protein